MATGSTINSNAADGAGGGGAGGSVLLETDTISGTITIDVSGSDGGNVANIGNNCNGPGGGGSGGVVWVNQSSLPASITVEYAGGSAGTTVSTTQTNCTLNGSNFATDGANGSVVTGLVLGESICAIPITLVADTICSGDSIFLQGAWQFASGIYTDYLSQGCCDSLVETDLTVLAKKTGSIVDSICFGDSIVVNGTSYTSSVTDAQEVFTNIGLYGCDSIVNINLTVTVLDTSVVVASPTLISNTFIADYQWLTCPEFTPIIGANSQSYTAIENGSYAVIITENGCTDTSDCFTISNLGLVRQTFGAGFSIFPNPTEGALTIDLGRHYETGVVYILDLSGSLVQHITFEGKQHLQLDIDQPPGTYFMRIEAQDKTALIRIIKQ